MLKNSRFMSSFRPLTRNQSIYTTKITIGVSSSLYKVFVPLRGISLYIYPMVLEGVELDSSKFSSPYEELVYIFEISSQNKYYFLQRFRPLTRNQSIYTLSVNLAIAFERGIVFVPLRGISLYIFEKSNVSAQPLCVFVPLRGISLYILIKTVEHNRKIMMFSSPYEELVYIS